MDLFFNELSVKQAGHPDIAKQWMCSLMKVYKSASRKGFKRLRTMQNISGELLAPNYSFSHWLKDQSVDQVIRLLFRSQALNAPFIEDILEKKSEGGDKLFEFEYNDKIAKGLGAAFLLDSLAVSFNNFPEWDKTSILIYAAYFSDEKADVIETDETVRHCCKTTHLEFWEKWIETVNKPPIPNGKILWLKRKSLFPHLIFCEDVKKQISHLHENHAEFVQIKKRLFELETYCSTWEIGPFDPGSIPSKVTPESSSRIESCQDNLTILCPDSRHRLFSWHSRYTPGAGRIHFDPDEDNRKIHVGYIGLKIQ